MEYSKVLRRMVIPLLLGALLLSGCSNGDSSQLSENDQQLIPVTVMLDWSPNTNHTGIYVAREQGIFEREGLKVEIVQPSAQGTVEQLVATGKVEFGISSQEQVTYARAQELPIVSIATIIQHNTSGFASFADKNIKTAKDFEGKVYGGWGLPYEEATIKTLMEKENADFSKVQMVNIGETDQIASLTQGDIDFVWIFYAWAGIQAEINDKQLNMIWLKDVDPVLDYYTPVIITGETLISENPDIVRRFMKAVSEGYAFAAEKPAEAAQILIDNVPEADSKLIMKSQEWLSSRYVDDASNWGIQKAEIWANYTEWLYEHGLIAKMIDAEKAFTNDFLPQ